MAHVDNDLESDPAAQWFIDEVSTVSKGKLQIKLVGQCCGRGDDQGAQLVRGVGTGDFDLGWVMTRGLEDLKVTSFQALSAPRLIDSYALEESVLNAGLEPSVFAGLSPLGVKGIALEPGTLRRPISSKAALLGPADWLGTTFWSYKSQIADATVQYLGATSTQVGLDPRDAGLEDGTITGTENSVLWQTLTEHITHPVITSNEAIWARINVLVANPHALSKLTSTQKGWLTQAADKVRGKTQKIASLDAGAVAAICGKEAGHFAAASEQQLADVDAKLRPVYTQLRTNALTSSLIDKITALKPADAPQEFTFPSGCLTPAP